MGVLRLARFIVARLLPRADREFILGDLDEMHRRWSREHGRMVAARRYLGASLASVAAQRDPRSRTGGSAPHRGGSRRGSAPHPFKSPGPWRSGLLADLRHASRLFRDRPGFVVVVALTLGLGIGAAGVVFSMANQLLLRPPPERAAVDGWMGPYSRGRPPIRISLPGAPDDAVGTADMRRVTPGWFEVLGVEPLLGRTLRESDARAAAAPVVVVTSRLAQRLFGRTDVVGQAVRVGRRPPREAEIVGMVGDVRIAEVRSEPDEAVFMPLIHENMGPVALLVRTSDTAPATATAIRRAVEDVIPSIAVPEPMPLTDRINDQLAEQRVFMRLLGLLSVLAVTLAAIGLYGVIAFAVAGRRREFGIRMAMGADGPRVAALVAWSAARIVASGTVLGLAGAYALSGVIESRLFGVEAVDAASYAGAAAMLAVIAALACMSPALAASRVEPAETLRQE